MKAFTDSGFKESAGRYGYSEWSYIADVKKRSSTTYELLIRSYKSAGVNSLGTPGFFVTGETWILNFSSGNSADYIILENMPRDSSWLFRLK